MLTVSPSITATALWKIATTSWPTIVPIQPRSRPTAASLARKCSVRATPVRKERPTRFQLLQKEGKRYITAYSCSLSRTDVRYNCGIYRHPKLYPIHWSFAVPKRVTIEQCLTWLRTRTYQPSAYSTMMHGHDFHHPISLNEPTYLSYLVHGKTYTKAPSLPTDQVSEKACQGEWVEYEKDHPLNHMMVYYDEILLWAVSMVVEETEIVDQHPSPMDAPLPLRSQPMVRGRTDLCVEYDRCWILSCRSS